MKFLDKKLLYKVFVIYIGTICMMAGPFVVNTIEGKIICIAGLAL